MSCVASSAGTGSNSAENSGCPCTSPEAQNKVLSIESEMQSARAADAAAEPAEKYSANSAQKIKLIATDLDGTFLNSKHKVSKRNAAAFRAAKEAGYIVLVSTGRSPTSAVEAMGKDTLEEMNYSNFAPGVFMNGMMVYGTDGELLYECAMTEKQLKSLINFLSDENLLNNLLVYEGPNIWCNEYNNHTAIPHVIYGEVNPKPIGEKLVEKQCSKAVVCAPDEKIVKVKEKILQKFGDIFDCFYALPQFLEIVPKGANKMSGILHLLEKLQIKPNEVMAVGDSENDCDLLRGVGFPVVVGNGCEAAKKIAMHIVSDNDKDPFADAVKLLCNIDV